MTKKRAKTLTKATAAFSLTALLSGCGLLTTSSEGPIDPYSKDVRTFDSICESIWNECADQPIEHIENVYPGLILTDRKKLGNKGLNAIANAYEKLHKSSGRNEYITGEQLQWITLNKEKKNKEDDEDEALRPQKRMMKLEYEQQKLDKWKIEQKDFPNLEQSIVAGTLAKHEALLAAERANLRQNRNKIIELYTTARDSFKLAVQLSTEPVKKQWAEERYKVCADIVKILTINKPSDGKRMRAILSHFDQQEREILALLNEYKNTEFNDNLHILKWIIDKNRLDYVKKFYESWNEKFKAPVYGTKGVFQHGRDLYFSLLSKARKEHFPSKHISGEIYIYRGDAKRVIAKSYVSQTFHKDRFKRNVYINHMVQAKDSYNQARLLGDDQTQRTAWKKILALDKFYEKEYEHKVK